MEWIEGLAVNQPIVAGAIAVAIGLVFCFFGYRIFRLVIALAGGIVGAGIGAGLGQFFSSALAVVVMTVAGAILGAVAAFLLYRLGVFLVGLVVFAGIGAAAMVAATGEPGVLVPLVAGVLGGVLALAFQKVVIVLYTALAGASLAAGGVGLILGTRTPGTIGPEDGMIAGLGVGGLILAVLGTVRQLRVRQKKAAQAGPPPRQSPPPETAPGV